MESELVRKLKKEILEMQGVKPMTHNRSVETGLGPVHHAFPYGVFPVGIHEFVSQEPEEAAATTGFMAGLISKLVRNDRTCLWIGNRRKIFPPGLHYFGVNPERIIFVEAVRNADLVWMLEQALRCEALGLVIGEMADMDPGQARRLQLTVEQCRVSCFLHRYRPRIASASYAVCRWRVKPLPGHTEEGLPGVGFPAWEVSLDKVRNGYPGSWKLQWVGDHFEFEQTAERKTGKSALLHIA